MSEYEADECIHGLGLVSACTICNGRERRERESHTEGWREFPAKYEGQCPACNLPIRVGSMIAWRPDDRPRHADCAS
jgi:hypothetical protein